MVELIKNYTYPILHQQYPDIPTIQEVLKLVNGQVLLDIEPKHDNPVGKLEKELVKLLDSYSGPFWVKPFHPFTVFWFRIHRPNCHRGQLAQKMKKGSYPLEHMWFNFITKPDFIAYQKEYAKEKWLQKRRKKFHCFYGLLREKKN